MGDAFRLQVPHQEEPQRETIKEIFAVNGYTYRKKRLARKIHLDRKMAGTYVCR